MIGPEELAVMPLSEAMTLLLEDLRVKAKLISNRLNHPADMTVRDLFELRIKNDDLTKRMQAIDTVMAAFTELTSG